MTDEPGYADDFRYFPSNQTVRFVATRNGEGPVSFGTWSFEEWGSIHAAEVGLEHVRNVTAQRLGTDAFGSGMGEPPAFASTDATVVWLHVTTTRNQEGEVVSTPRVPLSQLADVAPRSVDARVSLEGDGFSRTVPVFASHQSAQYL